MTCRPRRHVTPGRNLRCEPPLDPAAGGVNVSRASRACGYPPPFVRCVRPARCFMRCSTPRLRVAQFRNRRNTRQSLASSMTFDPQNQYRFQLPGPCGHLNRPSLLQQFAAVHLTAKSHRVMSGSVPPGVPRRYRLCNPNKWQSSRRAADRSTPRPKPCQRPPPTRPPYAADADGRRPKPPRSGKELRFSALICRLRQPAESTARGLRLVDVESGSTAHRGGVGHRGGLSAAAKKSNAQPVRRRRTAMVAASHSSCRAEAMASLTPSATASPPPDQPVPDPGHELCSKKRTADEILAKVGDAEIEPPANFSFDVYSEHHLGASFQRARRSHQAQASGWR